ncbi:MAG: MFS transporter [Micavibrio aeruginosavorus]|uniref:MFS transporter n=1 Tax=Micavibrio aeruginosavorus TaxID=349221 RepID=A0A7T5R275_9BACT|nr:MAG: MFS transporter [Micavibrio aeruginosavorus]
MNKKSIFAWCLFDWGNSAFSTVIVTFVFSVYFARGIVGDETAGSAQWGYALALSGILIALLSPPLGAIADDYGARKKFLIFFSLLCVIPTALLWLAVPDPAASNVLMVLTLVVIANIGFEVTLIFSNAMLAHIAPPAMIGRISGWAWGMGYMGGLFCLVLALTGLLGIGEMKPFIPLPQGQSAHIRATGPLTALWYFVFMMPLLLFTHDVGRTGLSIRAAARKGVADLWHTIRNVRQHKNLATFLLSSMIYRDGLNTLFAVGGLYAAGTLGMEFEEILIFAIGLNVTAGLGAVAFAWLDDGIGSRRTIMIALCGLMATGLAVVMVTDKKVFIGLALALGLFLGPVQSASRTLAARLSPPGMINQTYGFYGLTGKAISFLGPLVFAMATQLFDSQRAGIATILVFWLVGMVLLMKVKEPR